MNVNQEIVARLRSIADDLESQTAFLRSFNMGLRPDGPHAVRELTIEVRESRVKKLIEKPQDMVSNTE